MQLTGSFIRHIAYPAMERLKHNRIRFNMAELRDNEQQPEAALRASQREKLKHLMRHAVCNVPAYQKYTNLLSEIERDPENAIRQFPVLTKREFRERRDDFLVSNAQLNSLILNRSGGSTGEPVTFYMDRKTVEYSEAARWRGLSWWGIRIGDPCAMIWGSPIELTQHQARKHRLYERLLKNRIVISAFDLRIEKIGEYVRQLESFRPAYLYVWPSTLEIFVNLLEQCEYRPRLSLKAIVSTAETLHPHQRELFTRFFSCPVVNEYGAREGGILGYECPDGNIHATVDNSWMEVVHRTTLESVASGEPGLLLVTDLNNKVMPRIRYLLGDVVALSQESCSCGRGLPLFESFDGREDDTFIALDGSYVNGQYFTNVARMLPTIRQFQIIQISREEVALRLLNHDGLAEHDVSRFFGAIKRALGDVNVKIENVPEISPAASGKFRASIRRFPLYQV